MNEDEDQLDNEDEEEEIMNAQEQIFMQQQIEQEYMNALGEESDDGLVLAGGEGPGSGMLPMMMEGQGVEGMMYPKEALMSMGWI